MPNLEERAGCSQRHIQGDLSQNELYPPRLPHQHLPEQTVPQVFQTAAVLLSFFLLFTTEWTFHTAQSPGLDTQLGLPLPQSPSSAAPTAHPPTAPLFSRVCALGWGAVRAASQEAAWRTARRLCWGSIGAAGQTEARAQGEEEVWKWALTSLFQFPLVPVLLKGKNVVNQHLCDSETRKQVMNRWVCWQRNDPKVGKTYLQLSWALRLLPFPLWQQPC